VNKIKINSFVKAFKALGEPTRLKILKMLSVRPMCVCELSEVLDMAQPRISQHLRTLKEAGLVKESKEGYWVIYSLNIEDIRLIWQEFFDFLLAELQHVGGFEPEKKRLTSLKASKRLAGLPTIKKALEKEK